MEREPKTRREQVEEAIRNTEGVLPDYLKGYQDAMVDEATLNAGTVRRMSQEDIEAHKKSYDKMGKVMEVEDFFDKNSLGS